MASLSIDSDRMYQALVEKDPQYEGLFFVGVTTTGIFCRPTCTARKPRRDNVEFFASSREALHQGYRPCKVCRPMGPQGQTPDWLCPLIEDVHKTPGIRMTDQDLRDRALCPNRVRRWFQKHHGMTFQAYLRTLRIGDAFGRIRYGDSVSGAAFDTGYESLSGFTHTFKKATGVAPSHSRKKRLVTVTRLTTPLGPMMAGVVDETVCLLEFVDRRMLETQIARLKKRLHAEALPGQSPVFEELNRQLQEYFSGSRTTFTLPLDLPGTEFQQQVWAELLTIPYGATRSYKAQAAAIGRPTATRAVARANGDNRIAIIVPCHRVIGEDGSLTGYGGGLSRKEYLLNLERAHAK